MLAIIQFKIFFCSHLLPKNTNLEIYYTLPDTLHGKATCSLTARKYTLTVFEKRVLKGTF
jgi:hypothetical protein